MEQEPQAKIVLGFHEMERVIHQNQGLINDTFAILRMQSRLGNVLSQELEAELKGWAESGDGRVSTRIIDQIEIQQILRERDATVRQRRESGIDMTPDISPYFERSQADTELLKAIFRTHYPDADV